MSSNSNSLQVTGQHATLVSVFHYNGPCNLSYPWHISELTNISLVSTSVPCPATIDTLYQHRADRRLQLQLVSRTISSNATVTKSPNQSGKQSDDQGPDRLARSSRRWPPAREWSRRCGRDESIAQAVQRRARPRTQIPVRQMPPEEPVVDVAAAIRCSTPAKAAHDPEREAVFANHNSTGWRGRAQGRATGEARTSAI